VKSRKENLLEILLLHPTVRKLDDDIELLGVLVGGVGYATHPMFPTMFGLFEEGFERHHHHGDEGLIHPGKKILLLRKLGSEDPVKFDAEGTGVSELLSEIVEGFSVRIGKFVGLDRLTEFVEDIDGGSHRDQESLLPLEIPNRPILVFLHVLRKGSLGLDLRETVKGFGHLFRAELTDRAHF
jgi:hypothetical protein